MKIIINEKLKEFFSILLIIVIGALFLFFFKIKHSMNFTNLDELLWMYRSRFFIDNLITLDFSNLIQSYHPGIMVMWAIGPFMKIINYDFNLIANFIASLNEYNIINDSSQNKQIYNEYKQISFLLNIPIFSVIVMFIFSLYHLLKKLKLSKWTIMFSLLLITTTPYYIYFTTPTDKFLGIFSTLSVLCLLIYSSHKGNKKYLIFSAILGSWAALTKLSGLFLIPFSLFVLLFYKRNIFKAILSQKNIKKVLQPVKKIISDYLNWLLIFSVTSIIFLPTAIANPQAVKNIISGETTRRIIAENHNIFYFIDISKEYLSDPFLTSFNLFVISIFIIFLITTAKKIKREINNELLVLIIYFFSFFIFTIMFSRIYSFRYLVPILIIFQIIAGMGIYEFSNMFIKKYNITDKKIIYYWIIIFILVSQGLLIYYSKIEKIQELPYFG